MARPREFDEAAVLDAAVQCFWSRGYQATSVRDLLDRTGLTGASLYNAFGDKRSVFMRALAHYVDGGLAERIRLSETMEPRAALVAFFQTIVHRSLEDPEHKGCMLVNTALDVVAQEPEFREAVAEVLRRIEAFLLSCVVRGQTDGTISSRLPPEQLASHLLGVLIGVRVLARVRPERALLDGIIAPALSLLAPEPDAERGGS